MIDEKIYMAMIRDNNYLYIMGLELTTASEIAVDFARKSAGTRTINKFDSIYAFASNQQLMVSGTMRSGSDNYWSIWGFKASDLSIVFSKARTSSNVLSNKLINYYDGSKN